MLLEFRGIEKSFGNKKVLTDVSFSAESGVANGYLGRNGSGKTTTFRILLNILKPDKGRILLDGKVLDHKDIKIGYLPEERGMYDDVGLVDQLVYFGRLKGMTKEAAKKEAKEWLDYFELTDNKKQLKTLSKGNAQKIQIIQSLMNNPDILIFDEPFSGLDPVNVTKLKEIMLSEIKKGKLLIFSSHQMPVVENICDEITIIDNGKVTLNGNLEIIKKQLGNRRMLLEVSNIGAEELMANLKVSSFNIDYSIAQNKVLLDFKDMADKKRLIEKLANSNFDIDEFKLYKPSLEEIFVQMVGDK